MVDAPSGNQEDVPAFSAEPPKRPHSWTDKGLNWGDQKEVEALQRKVKAVVDTGVKLVDVVHMMLHRPDSSTPSLSCSDVEVQAGDRGGGGPEVLPRSRPQWDVEGSLQAQRATHSHLGRRTSVFANHVPFPRYFFI